MPPVKKALDLDNFLFHALARDGSKTLSSHANEVVLENGKVIYEAGEAPKLVYFPVDGTLVSLLTLTEEGELVEVGLVGNEGLLGHQVLGANVSMHRALVQSSGPAITIPPDVLQRAFNESELLRAAFLRYFNYLILQISQTALCNRLHSVEERLARWLLLSLERTQRQQLPLTHETLGHMLGTRRSTVTLAASVFQRAGLIRYQRGKITILDPDRLAQTACSCFAANQKHLRWLLNGASRR